MSNKGNIKEQVAKQRLKLTAAALKMYNEQFLKNPETSPMGVLNEVMLNAPRDADKIGAAKELLRMCYQRPPNESEVQLNDDVGVWAMSPEEKKAKLDDKLSALLAKMGKDSSTITIKQADEESTTVSNNKDD